MNTHGHQSQRPIRRSVPTIDNQWVPEQNNMKTKSYKMSDILHSDPGPHRTSDQMSPLQERTQPSVQEAYDTLKNEHMHTSHKRSFLLPYIFFHLSFP